MPRITTPALFAFLTDALANAPATCFLPDPEQDRLRKEKRHSPMSAHDPKRALAGFLAERIFEAGFVVQHDEPQHLGSPPEWSGNR